MFLLSRLKALTFIVGVATISNGCANESESKKEVAHKNKPAKYQFDIGRVTREEAKAIEKPKNFKNAVAEARRCIEEADYKTAIQYAEYAIEFRPNSQLGYYLKGRAKYDLGLDEVDSAIADFLKAEKFKPLDAGGSVLIKT